MQCWGAGTFFYQLRLPIFSSGYSSGPGAVFRRFQQFWLLVAFFRRFSNSGSHSICLPAPDPYKTVELPAPQHRVKCLLGSNWLNIIFTTFNHTLKHKYYLYTNFFSYPILIIYKFQKLKKKEKSIFINKDENIHRFPVRQVRERDKMHDTKSMTQKA